MQLLSVIKARSIWLLDILELNPHGKYIELALLEWLKANYHFLKFPSSIYDRDQNGGFSFAQGDYKIKDDLSISVDLSIYGDGLIADTRSSTKDTDAFLENVLSLVVKDFGIVYHPEMIRKKLYVSELNIRSKHYLSGLHPKLQAFAKRITSLLGDQDATVFETTSIGFGPDPAFPVQQAPFQFERKLNAPFSEHRYYSRAPLHTDDHLKLLEEFEELLLGGISPL